MDTTTTTVRVIQLGQAPQEIEVPVGTTLAQLCGDLGVPGAETMSALAHMMEPIGPNHAITEDTSVINLVYKLAGA